MMGPLTPHSSTLDCLSQVRLQSLAVYLDYKLDESYTPNKVSVSAGTSYDDLKHIKTIDMEEPSGWVTIPLQIPGMRCAMLLAVKQFLLQNVLHPYDRFTFVERLAPPVITCSAVDP